MTDNVNEKVNQLELETYAANDVTKLLIRKVLG